MGAPLDAITGSSLSLAVTCSSYGVGEIDGIKAARYVTGNSGVEAAAGATAGRRITVAPTGVNDAAPFSVITVLTADCTRTHLTWLHLSDSPVLSWHRITLATDRQVTTSTLIRPTASDLGQVVIRGRRSCGFAGSRAPENM